MTTMYKFEDGKLQPFTEADIAQSGKDVQQYQLVQSQIKLELAYAERNKRLVDSDWTQLPDVPLTDEQKTAWQTYRQSLRDITETPGWPDAIEWPVPPA